MNNSMKRKNDFLGVPYGTACNKLRKNLLFYLVCELGKDICFRCGNKINRPEDLSIDHIRDWLGNSRELFWDLNNITFSHLSCNSLSRRRFGPEPKKGPLGTEYCYKCKQFKTIDNFGPMGVKGRNRKVRDYCKSCRRESGQ